MNILFQLYYSAKRILVNIKGILIRLASYMLIILILGSAFQDSFGSNSLDKVKLYILNEDKGEHGNEFLESFQSVDEIKKFATFQSVESKEKGISNIQEKNAGAMLVVPEDFSKKVESGEQKKVQVYAKMSTGTDSIVVKSIMDTYLSAYNVAGVVLKIAGEEGGKIIEDAQKMSGSYVESVPLSTKVKSSSMSYYTVGMLLMLMLYGMEYGIAGANEDYFGILGKRLKMSPMKPYEQYLGKMIGCSLVTFIQGIGIVLFSKLAFHLYWGDNIALLLLVLYLFSLLVTTLGAMLCILLQDADRAYSMMSILAILFTFLAGGFVSMDIGFAEKLSPSYYVKTAIFNIMYGGTKEAMLKCIGALCGMIIVFAAVSILGTRRKEE